MTSSKTEWLKVVDLAREIRERKVPGLPVSTASLRDFIHMHRVNDDATLAKATVFRNGTTGFLYHISFLEKFAQAPSDEWASISDLLMAKLPGMPASRTVFNKLVQDSEWRSDASRYRAGRGAGSTFEYHISVLPESAREAWREYVANGRTVALPDGVENHPEPARALAAPTEKGKKSASSADLSTVKNSALIAELVIRIFRALGDDDGRSA